MPLRRSVLAGAVAYGAPAILTRHVAYAQPVASPRRSLLTFAQDPARLASLRRGIAVMKSRPHSQPKSWFFQAAIHGVTAEALAEARQQDPGMAQVDVARFWNQCPHFGQHSANFIIWHRAYLHYFERILREAAGDPTLSLPYWDYGPATQRRFPAAFARPFLDANETIRNPLHHDEREQAFVFGVFGLTDPAVDASAAMEAPTFFGATEDDGFGGAVLDEIDQTQGLIESQPHNTIHFAVGGAIGSVGGAMASVATAAFDPIFWVHHANIDRLWTEWSCAPAKAWGDGPPTNWFDERPWSFHDIGGVVDPPLPRRAYVDHRALGLAYDTVPATAVPLAAPEPLVASTSPRRPMRQSVLAAANGGSIEAGRAFSTTLTASAGAAAAAGGRRFIEISGIVVDRPPNVGFDVYINRPPTAPMNRRSPHRLGSLNLFGIGGHVGHHQHGATQRFAVPPAMEREIAAGNVRVEIAPFDLLVPTGTAAAALERRGQVSFRNVGLVSQQR